MTDFVDAPITWIVFTFNEAARIERVVRNLRKWPRTGSR